VDSQPKVAGPSTSKKPGAQVALVRRAVLVADVAEDEHLAGPEDVGGQPVEGRPVDAQPQVGFGLLREAPDGRAVEGEVVGRLQQELLVVVEHVEAALEVGEAHRHGLDPLLVGQVLDALVTDAIRWNAVEPCIVKLTCTAGRMAQTA
jgi:hypothetical protein